jgi:ArsR family metal-binding transcriptional regulator
MTTSINENELESISEEINNIIQEFIDNNNNNNVSNEYYYDDDRKFEEYINE